MTLFSYMMEEAVSFLGRVARRLYLLVFVDKYEVANRSW